MLECAGMRTHPARAVANLQDGSGPLSAHFDLAADRKNAAILREDPIRSRGQRYRAPTGCAGRVQRRLDGCGIIGLAVPAGAVALHGEFLPNLPRCHAHEEEKGDEEKRESLREQEQEKGQPPKKLEGIGDDAYWTANRMGGALYVLKNDVFIRISVGGPESEDAKINRCKALAEKALSHL